MDFDAIHGGGRNTVRLNQQACESSISDFHMRQLEVRGILAYTDPIGVVAAYFNAIFAC
ncbi:hypothetical protein D3C85_958350 [compost metagenome]